MKRDLLHFQGQTTRLPNHGASLPDSSSSSPLFGKDKMVVKEEEDGGHMDDELLAVLGYKVKSSEMAEVALKLEQLETMMGNVQEDGLSHLATETVHYNPAELYTWLDSMLTELNPAAGSSGLGPSLLQPPPPPEIENSFLTGADSSTISSIGFVGQSRVFGEPSSSDYVLRPISGNAVYLRSQSQMQNQFAIDSSSSTNEGGNNHNNKRLKCSSPDSMVTSPSTAAQIGGVIGTTVTTTTTTSAGAAGESTRAIVLVDSQENGVRLVHALMACAEAIQKNNLTLAEALVKQIGFLAVSQAGAMRKVATYFAEALARRIYCLSPPQNPIDHSLSDTLQMHFYETCPYLKFAHFTANQAILDAFEGKQRVHVVDFSMNQGLQWPALMQALAVRPGGPPVFRLTGIGPPAPDNSDHLHEVGCKLAQLAEAINVEFEYRGFVANSLADLDASMLELRPSEIESVAVNSVFELHKLLGRPGAIEKVLGTIYNLISKNSLPFYLSIAEPIMSDEEHQFESKADAGASKTYPQQAGNIRKGGHIVIKGRPCKVVEVSTSKTGKHGHAKCHFVAIDIFTAKKLEDIVPSSHNCDVPHVNRTDYQLIDISEDGFVSLLTDSGGTKDDLKLPTDDTLLTQMKSGFEDGKDVVVSVMSAMGEEQICAVKEVGGGK